MIRFKKGEKMIENIFNLENYIKYLKEFYVYPYDKNTYEERATAIEKYDQEYLGEIVENTKKFCFEVLDKIKEENNIYRNQISTNIRLAEECCSIRNGCCGGYPSDIVVMPEESPDDFYISEYLVKHFFKGFQIYENYDIEELFNEEEQAGIEFLRQKLTISGPLEEFNLLYDATKQELGEKLIRTLKK